MKLLKVSLIALIAISMSSCCAISGKCPFASKKSCSVKKSCAVKKSCTKCAPNACKCKRK